jgi:GMP reductase
MRIDYNIHLDYADVLLKPKRSTLSSRRDVDMTRDFTFRNSKQQISFVPVVASNMDGVGTFSMARVLQEYKLLTVLRKHYAIADWDRAIGTGLKLQYVSACTGTGAMWDNNSPDYQTLKKVMEKYPDVSMITIDVANAYHEQFVDFVKRIRSEFPDKTIIAGNVVSPEMVEELIINGADVVKVGIGPGSVCTTRTQTGVGVPQFSAIIECADAANGVGGHIIADGGCTQPGDIAKALAAGAHMVMLGGMLAAHDESELELRDGKRVFYGMSSESAFEKHGARKDGYRGTEGKTVKLDNKGPVKDTVEQILGGVRSTCTYIGARRIKDMPKCAHFVRVNNVINRVFDRYETNKD